jgi:superfamily I DNA and RNA helicase
MSPIQEFADWLKSKSDSFGLGNSEVYTEFPIFRNAQDQVLIADIVIASSEKGIILLGLLPGAKSTHVESLLEEAEVRLFDNFNHLEAKLRRERKLCKGIKGLSFNITPALVAPGLNITDKVKSPDDGVEIISGLNGVGPFLNKLSGSRIDPLTFRHLLVSIEGTTCLTKPKSRDTSDPKKNLARIVAEVEDQLGRLDKEQKEGADSVITGLQRIRGLAGSGKTIILARKAALLHLRDKDAIIVYTFYTKSLYQHIRSLIRRFFKEYDDREPNWEKVRVIHAWGGVRNPGVYYEASLNNGFSPKTFSEVKNFPYPFKYICEELLKNELKPIYDYMLVDEGQDMPLSFLHLCKTITKNKRVVWAYDELQDIFNVRVGTAATILDQDESFERDIVLHTCYRNPREILVVAHALGFGIYGPAIAQMLENESHWEDLGYRVIKGDFKPGSQMLIERPKENSPLLSDSDTVLTDVVTCNVYSDFETEIASVAASVYEDIQNGLLPEDIAVVTVDDRNARGYLEYISTELKVKGLAVNNMHIDSFGMADFERPGEVTLTTVQKAKGNESYMVYVIGIDALFSGTPTVVERNKLFAAITRAKCWVRLSGVGQAAEDCKQEMDAALANFPNLAFTYPSEEGLRKMKRDLETKGAQTQHARRRLESAIDSALKDLSPEDVRKFVAQRATPKG